MGLLEANRRLESLARWLNAHPGQFNMWPWLCPTGPAAKLTMTRIRDHYYDAFRVDMSLLEFRGMWFDGEIALMLRVIA